MKVTGLMAKASVQSEASEQEEETKLPPKKPKQRGKYEGDKRTKIQR
jgi:hypothetical protein